MPKLTYDSDSEDEQTLPERAGFPFHSGRYCRTHRYYPRPGVCHECDFIAQKYATDGRIERMMAYAGPSKHRSCCFPGEDPKESTWGLKLRLESTIRKITDHSFGYSQERAKHPKKSHTSEWLPAENLYPPSRFGQRPQLSALSEYPETKPSETLLEFLRFKRLNNDLKPLNDVWERLFMTWLIGMYMLISSPLIFIYEIIVWDINLSAFLALGLVPIVIILWIFRIVHIVSPLVRLILLPSQIVSDILRSIPLAPEIWSLQKFFFRVFVKCVHQVIPLVTNPVAACFLLVLAALEVTGIVPVLSYVRRITTAVHNITGELLPYGIRGFQSYRDGSWRNHRLPYIREVLLRNWDWMLPITVFFLGPSMMTVGGCIFVFLLFIILTVGYEWEIITGTLRNFQRLSWSIVHGALQVSHKMSAPQQTRFTKVDATENIEIAGGVKPAEKGKGVDRGKGVEPVREREEKSLPKVSLKPKKFKKASVSSDGEYINFNLEDDDRYVVDKAALDRDISSLAD